MRSFCDFLSNKIFFWISEFVPNRIGLSWTSCRLPCCQDQVDYIIHPCPLANAGEQCWTISSHQFRVSVHNFKWCSNMWCQIDLILDSAMHSNKKIDNYRFSYLVNHKKVRLGDTWAAFARNLIATLSAKGLMSGHPQEQNRLTDTSIT